MWIEKASLWIKCLWPQTTTITSLRTTVWAACPCPTAYMLLLLNHYVLLCEQKQAVCEQPAVALWHTRYYYYITTYYFVSSLPLPSSNAYGVGQGKAAHTVVRSDVTRMP